jgi:hypothetical protein
MRLPPWEWRVYCWIRSSRLTVTTSPAFLPIALRTSERTGSICVPSPLAIKEPRNGWPSIFPRTFTSPRVRKKSTDSGQTTYVHAPLSGLLRKVAVKRRFNFIKNYPSWASSASSQPACVQLIASKCALKLQSNGHRPTADSGETDQPFRFQTDHVSLINPDHPFRLNLITPPERRIDPTWKRSPPGWHLLSAVCVIRATSAR